jgi:hypothetical protein
MTGENCKLCGTGIGLCRECGARVGAKVQASINADAERALGIELSGGGWEALAEAMGVEDDDDWDGESESAKRAYPHSDSGRGGGEGTPASGSVPWSKANREAGVESCPRPDSLLPRLVPPVHFDPLPPLHATTAAVSRSKLAEREEDSEAQPEIQPDYLGFHRRWDLLEREQGVTTYCDDCQRWHTAPTKDELVEILDATHGAPEPDPDEYWERKRDLR